MTEIGAAIFKSTIYISDWMWKEVAADICTTETQMDPDSLHIYLLCQSDDDFYCESKTESGSSRLITLK